jgi:hypothetical protein
LVDRSLLGTAALGEIPALRRTPRLVQQTDREALWAARRSSDFVVAAGTGSVAPQDVITFSNRRRSQSPL